ncbi:DNA adenine methylase [Stenotrophomonas cyclobalanopsidis]|uniref:site-specific DNA-methyltransferase (adenine-specific) n=1 Tax=Stenotrophomonas cyclobalanopsidis TaxID=2771362 RepID=A0ABQ6T2B6_9GAMM|nr:DNA adenine methylase [Stenotrophomonas cyclobalanopsidis]KAA9000795.1 DNA adenine methylase [Stenotrophomonas cyclobalanopsidis]
MPVTYSPLRYPGGKTQLTPFVVDLLRANDLFYGSYAEPFAGGCGVALKLLMDGFMSEIYINDIDPAIYSMWNSVINETDELCSLIERTPITIAEWRRQRAIQDGGGESSLELGFSTLFMNRTNRSGILKAGVIGGFDQRGDYLIDCRFHKVNLIKKIRRIALYADHIHLTQLDAIQFLRKVVKKIKGKALVNIDPPYYKKGPELYRNFYGHDDHVLLSREIAKLGHPWMVTYDNAPEIREIYDGYPALRKTLRYSAQVKRMGVELLILDPTLKAPRREPSKSATSAA